MSDNEKQFKDIKANLRKSVALGAIMPLEQSFSDDFMQRTTQFESLETMIDALAHFVMERGDEWDDEWEAVNVFISENTDFDNWPEMRGAALGNALGSHSPEIRVTPYRR